MNPLLLARTTIDFETRSEVDVRDVGSWRYAEHPTTKILSMAWRTKTVKEVKNHILPVRKPKLWTPATAFPSTLTELACSKEHMFESHSVQFEFAIWYHQIFKKLGIAMPTRWVDTQATCAYRAIPLGLDNVGVVLNLDIKKDKRGKYLLQKLSKPRRALMADKKLFDAQGLDMDEWPVLWTEDWGLMEELYDYNITDVESEDNLGHVLGDLPLSEYNLWTLDQRINNRGMFVDREAVDASISILEVLFAGMQEEVQRLTDGRVKKGTEVAAIRQWVEDQGVNMPDLQADTVTDTIERFKDDPGYEDVCKVLELRQTLGSTSVKKLYKVVECLCNDDKLYGMLQYHGAGTGRWSGRLAQPHNFPRGELEDFVKHLGLADNPDGAAITMEILTEIIKLRGQSAIDMLQDVFGAKVITCLSTMLRGLFISQPDHLYRVADFSAIEAVVLAWLAGEEWKVKAFEAIQRGEGYKGSADIYCAAATKVFGKKITNKKEFPKERQVGKTCELAFGYQGAIGAWRNFDRSDRYTDWEVQDFCTTWRKEHPAIAGVYTEYYNRDGELKSFFDGGLWNGLNAAAVKCMQLNKAVRYDKVIFEPITDKAGKWMTIVLPNSRRLWYFDPELDFNQWGRPCVTYQGRDNKRGGAWDRVSTYGGMLSENIVQAISRDLMAEAMIRVEIAGYRIVLTVHDEIISEDPVDFGSQEEFEMLMSIVPDWAKGCPVAVDGWFGTRYRK